MASAYLVPTASRNSSSNLSISSYALSILSTTRLTYSFSSAPTFGHESPTGAVTAFGPPSMASVGSAIGLSLPCFSELPGAGPPLHERQRGLEMELVGAGKLVVFQCSGLGAAERVHALEH